MKTLSPLRCYDFQGHGWHSAFTIEEVVESMTDILPEPGQLRGWLDNLEDPVLQTNSTTGSSIEATVHLNPSGTVQIRLPPSGTLKDGREKKLQHIYSVVGFGLFEAYKGQVPSSPRELHAEPDATRKRQRSEPVDPPASVNKGSGGQRPSTSPGHDQPGSPIRASSEPSKSDGPRPSTSLPAGSPPDSSQTGAHSSIGQPRVVHGRVGRGARGGRRPARGGLKIVRQ
ncbi:hypothetical protein WJX74_010376 [Apatococcus lobatus]|uniref:Uncharacterized protein n=1 Tax=Apatococcus lobatus TaxID=904363 RepID=A0AAW1S395_9CHLO